MNDTSHHCHSQCMICRFIDGDAEITAPAAHPATPGGQVEQCQNASGLLENLSLICDGSCLTRSHVREKAYIHSFCIMLNRGEGCDLHPTRTYVAYRA